MTPREFIAAVGREDEQAHRRDRLREEAQQVEAGGIDPVQIVEQQHNGPGSGEGIQESAHLSEEGVLTSDRADLTTLSEDRRRRGEDGIGPIAVKEVQPGAVGGGLGEIEAPPRQNERAPFGCFPADGLGEGGLADARLAADQHNTAPPGEGGIEVFPEERQFPIAPDQERPNAERREDGHERSLPCAERAMWRLYPAAPAGPSSNAPELARHKRVAIQKALFATRLEIKTRTCANG